ncbi:MAG TPA: heparan-alpha-glucosaminide N-acetyltransferase domain-containing protein [Gemmatimonadales bacterium]|nr:heparan-alpha-glucosaminide N-acetyltransferase domain-containing protein [Gemmatimonadales bacterium]
MTARAEASATVAPATPAARGSATAAGRLISLDVFRGATVAAMLLVNAPGSWSAIYPPLRHAEWNGWTPTDLIFPFFLFIVGVTTHLSLMARRKRGDDERALVRQVLRRGVVIIVLGLLVSAFPFFPRDWIAHLRIPGVLQRIGVVYLCAGLIVLRSPPRTQLLIAGAILVGYWLLLALAPVPGVGPAALAPPDATLAAWLDRLLLGGHLWPETRTWDPEGILATVPAVATALLGAAAGRRLTRPEPLSVRLNQLFGAGAIATVGGLVWSWGFPINKNLWTSSYVVFTAGLAAMSLATCTWLIEERKAAWWVHPFVVFGVNPITAFVGSELAARLIYTVVRVPYGGASVPVETAVFRAAFASWLPARAASLAFAIVFVACWYVVLAALWRRRIILKV